MNTEQVRTVLASHRAEMGGDSGGLLPTFDERARQAPTHGAPRDVVMADAAFRVGDQSHFEQAACEDDDSPPTPPPPRRAKRAPPQAPSSGASSQPASSKVFRVTTIEDGDYDSIPLQRLKNVIGADGLAARLGVWLLFATVIASVFLATLYMHAKMHYVRAVKISAHVRSLDTSQNDVVRWLKRERTAPEVRAKYPTMSRPSTRLHTTATNNPRHPLSLSHELRRMVNQPGAPRRSVEQARVTTGHPSDLNDPELLRLPVGLATTFDIQQLIRSKEFDNDITPGHDSIFHRLKTLREALPVDVYQATSNKRVRFDILRLLRVARRARVVTEVPLAVGSGKLASGWGAGAHDGFSGSSPLLRAILCVVKGVSLAPPTARLQAERGPQNAELRVCCPSRLMTLT